jgi:hypothetical protein
MASRFFYVFFAVFILYFTLYSLETLLINFSILAALSRFICSVTCPYLSKVKAAGSGVAENAGCAGASCGCRRAFLAAGYKTKSP